MSIYYMKRLTFGQGKKYFMCIFRLLGYTIVHEHKKK